MLRLLYALSVTGLVVALILITDNAPTASLAQNGPVSSPVGSPEPTEEPTEEPTKEPTEEPGDTDDDAGTGATTAVTLPSTGVGAIPSVFSVPLLTLLASVVGLLAVAAHLVRGRT